MVKWWNTLVEISSLQNGKMEKSLNSPSSDLSFLPPSKDGDQASFLTPSAAASAVSASVVSGRCHVDIRIFPQAATMNVNAVSPHCFQSIHYFYAFLPPSPTPGGGGVVPFCNLLIFAIVCCPYTGDIIYDLCDTITYTTSTSATWSLHDQFVKVYF